MDAAEIRNPKLTLARREQEAMEATPASAPASGAMTQSQFAGKPKTQAQKAQEAAKLAQMLRSR